MTNDDLDKLVEHTAESLGEHFEAVVIIGTRANPNEGQYSQIFRASRGNYFAQLGMMHEVLASEQAYAVARKIIQRRDEQL